MGVVRPLRELDTPGRATREPAMLVNTLARRTTSSLLIPALCVLPFNYALASDNGRQVSTAKVIEPADDGGEVDASAGEPGRDDESSELGEEGAADAGVEAEEADAEAGDEEEAAADDEEPADEGEPGAAPPEEAAAEGPPRPPEPKFGKHSATGRGMMLAGTVLTGVGAGLIAFSWIATECNYDSAFECKFADQRTFFVPTSVALTGLGLVLLATGLGYRGKYKRWENWQPGQQAMVVPTVMRGGGGLGLVGRF